MERFAGLGKQKAKEETKIKKIINYSCIFSLIHWFLLKFTAYSMFEHCLAAGTVIRILVPERLLEAVNHYRLSRSSIEDAIFSFAPLIPRS